MSNTISNQLHTSEALRASARASHYVDSLVCASVGLIPLPTHVDTPLGGQQEGGGIHSSHTYYQLCNHPNPLVHGDATITLIAESPLSLSPLSEYSPNPSSCGLPLWYGMFRIVPPSVTGVVSACRTMRE